MNLEELKNKFKSACLAHKSINSFDYGEDFLLATGKGEEYPLTFLEIPYNLNYDLTTNKFKTFQFALLVLIKPTNDAVIEDHQDISNAEVIGDAIITKAQTELKADGVAFESVSGVSLREFSDDNASGVRFDIQVKTFRAFCYNSYEDQFNQ